MFVDGEGRPWGGGGPRGEQGRKEKEIFLLGHTRWSQTSSLARAREGSVA